MAEVDTLEWEHLFVMRLNVAYSEVQQIGGENKLGIFPVHGGTFEGPKLRGKILSDGADWVTWSADGTMNIDVRTSLETDDGAKIAMYYTGIAATTSPEAAARFRQRLPAEYGDMYIHTTPRFVTEHPDYEWLNRVIAVTNGMRTTEGPMYQVFAIK